MSKYKQMGDDAAMKLATTTPIRYPVELFQKYFLLAFLLPRDQAAEGIEAWITKVATDVNIPVDLVDASGRVVVTVPPILSSRTIVNMGEVASEVEEAHNLKNRTEVNIPKIAASRFNASMESLPDLIGDNTIVSNSWKEFYEYFNIKVNEDKDSPEDNDLSDMLL